MEKITLAMITLRASRISGGATEQEVDALILALNVVIGPTVRIFLTGEPQLMVDAVNTSDLTADEKAQFITDIT